MTFTDHLYYLVFIVIAAVHLLLPGKSPRQAFLLLASLALYWTIEPVFVWILLIQVTLNHVLALSMDRGPRKTLLLASLVLNLGQLLFFKYTAFFLDNLHGVLGWPSGGGESWRSWWLPVGISFFTFQIQSYLLDVYYRVLPPEKSWLRVALFACFFPQLVAGPIVKARHFLPQLQVLPSVKGEDLLMGVQWITSGLFLKVVIADNLAQYTLALADPTYTVRHALNLLVLSWSFMAQVFGDFGGYSLIAMGLARCLGYRLPLNFNAPFLAVGFNDFWKRWHISLTQWFRDYLFLRLSMGSFLKGRLYTCLLITFLVSGFWHGAHWSYVVWGGLHGLGCALETWCTRRGWRWSNPMVRGLQWAITFQSVCFLGIFFYHTSLSSALGYFSALVGESWHQPLILPRMADMVFFLGLLALHHLVIWCREASRSFHAWSETMGARSLLILLNLLALCSMWGEARTFIYFQF